MSRTKGASNSTLVAVLILTACLATGSAYVFASADAPTREGGPPAWSLPQLIAAQQENETEAAIVLAFNEKRCQAVTPLLRPEYYDRLSPLATAVAGYCESNYSEAVRLLTRAETLEPGNDSIAYLHARYVWERNPRLAQPLWKKVMLVARDPSYRREARAHLEGQEFGTDALDINPLWIIRSSITLGTGAETNPTGPLLLPNQRDKISPFSNTIVTARVERHLPFGSLSVLDRLAWRHYFAGTLSNLIINNIELPFSIRGGSMEDLQVRPLGTLTGLDGSAFYFSGGVAIAGISYRGVYRQRCQASILWDKYYFQQLRAQGGAHYRFDYEWELFPVPWFYRLLFYVEHVQAGRDINRRGTILISNIPYSRNDISLEGSAELHMSWITLGIVTNVLFSDYINDSTYPASNGSTVIKQRSDFQVSLSPTVFVPLSSATRLRLAYQWIRRYSNFGPEDFSDKAFEDHVAHASVQVSLNIL